MNIDSSRKSKNSSSRNGEHPRMLVWHSTAGRERSDVPILLGQTARRVSSHYYITKDGRIMQFVDDSLASWHAGVSKWNGASSGVIQDTSIGIELENLNNGVDPYPQAQLSAAIALGRYLVGKYNIKREWFVTHRDIAQPAGRKSDPAGFPWNAFVAEVYGGSGTPAPKPEPTPAPKPEPTPAPKPYPGAAQPKENIDVTDTAKAVADSATASMFSLDSVFAAIARVFNSFLDSLN